jgi:hypothetical protein
MAALVAWPRRGEDGSGSQYRHFIEGGVAANQDKKIIQFLSVELTCAALVGDQVFTLLIKGGKDKEIPSCLWLYYMLPGEVDTMFNTQRTCPTGSKASCHEGTSERRCSPS